MSAGTSPTPARPDSIPCSACAAIEGYLRVPVSYDKNKVDLLAMFATHRLIDLDYSSTVTSLKSAASVPPDSISNVNLLP